MWEAEAFSFQNKIQQTNAFIPNYFNTHKPDSEYRVKRENVHFHLNKESKKKGGRKIRWDTKAIKSFNINTKLEQNQLSAKLFSNACPAVPQVFLYIIKYAHQSSEPNCYCFIYPLNAILGWGTVWKRHKYGKEAVEHSLKPEVNRCRFLFTVNRKGIFNP